MGSGRWFFVVLCLCCVVFVLCCVCVVLCCVVLCCVVLCCVVLCCGVVEEWGGVAWYDMEYSHGMT